MVARAVQGPPFTGGPCTATARQRWLTSLELLDLLGLLIILEIEFGVLHQFQIPNHKTALSRSCGS
jgi:hypothetical protein